MNRDPFGLGRLLYGFRPTPAGPGTLLAAGLTSLTLIPDGHGDCGISTFCKNPLHPGPCKGWKKNLGIQAPGALHAIEEARKAKVVAKRKATNEAKSAASKSLTGRQLSSPLHAKKATIKNANILLGHDEAKAGQKADRVILNKTEIKKYSKIKAAQMNALRSKHGLEEDPGLEDRIAEALALDNKSGKDDHYKAAIGNASWHLGTQLAQKHCKKGDGDCDGIPFETLRDALTNAAEGGLLTGDDTDLDAVLADYDGGKLDVKPKPPASPAAQVKQAVTAPNANNDDIVKAGLQLTKADLADLESDEIGAVKAALAVGGPEAKAKLDELWPKPPAAPTPEPDAPAAPAAPKVKKPSAAQAKIAEHQKLTVADVDGMSAGEKQALRAELEKLGKNANPQVAHDAKAMLHELFPGYGYGKPLAVQNPDSPNVALADKGMQFGLGLKAFIAGNKTLGPKAAQKSFADKIQSQLDGNPDHQGMTKQGAATLASALTEKTTAVSMAKPYMSLTKGEKNAVKLKLADEIQQGLEGNDAPTPMLDAMKAGLTGGNDYDFPAVKAAQAQVADLIKQDAAIKLGVDPNAPAHVVAAHVLWAPDAPTGQTGTKLQVLDKMTVEEYGGLPPALHDEIKTWLEERATAFEEVGGDNGQIQMEQAQALQAKLGLPVHAAADAPAAPAVPVMTHNGYTFDPAEFLTEGTYPGKAESHATKWINLATKADWDKLTREQQAKMVTLAEANNADIGHIQPNFPADPGAALQKIKALQGGAPATATPAGPDLSIFDGFGVSDSTKTDALHQLDGDAFDELPIATQIKIQQFLNNEEQSYFTGSDSHADVMGLKAKFGLPATPAPFQLPPVPDATPDENAPEPQWVTTIKGMIHAADPNSASIASVYETLTETEKTWLTPHELLVAKEAAKKVGTPAAPAVAGPVDVSGWTKVGGQGGSNLGGMYSAPDGTRYYVKSLKSEEHAQSEVLAAALYKAAGIDVPEVQHGTGHPDGWKNVVVSKVVPGASDKGKLTGPGQFKKDAQDGFAVDAWLANYDTVGLTHDNIVDSNGKPVRIDVGGSLAYRAQGQKKTDWNDDPTAALTGLKSSSKNPQAASVFGGMTPAAEKKSAEHLLSISDDQIDQLVADAGMPPAMAATLKARKKAILAKYGLGTASTGDPIQDLIDKHNATPITVTPLTSVGEPDVLQQLLDGVPTAPAAVMPALSKDGKKAVDFATGAKSGTAGAKFKAYQMLEGEEFQQLPADTQKLIMADLDAIHDKFVAPNKKVAVKAAKDYLSPFMGGGAGAGGAATSTAPPALTDAQKAEVGAEWLASMTDLINAPGTDPAKAKVAAHNVLKAAAANGSYDKLATEMGNFQATISLKAFSNKHLDPDGNPLFDPAAISIIEPVLAQDIAKKLKGDTSPTPTLNAWVKAMKSGTGTDAQAVADAATGYTAGDATPGTPAHPLASPMDKNMVTGNTALAWSAAGLTKAPDAMPSNADLKAAIDDALSDGVGSPKHQQWAKETSQLIAEQTFDSAYEVMGFDDAQQLKMSSTAVMDYVAILEQDYQKALLSTDVHDGGKPAVDIWVAAQAVQTASQTMQASQGWAPDSPAVKDFEAALFGAKLDELVQQHVAKHGPPQAGAGGGTSAPNPAAPSAPAGGPVGTGTGLAGISLDTQQEILAQLKAQPDGKYLSHPKEATHGNLLALAAAHSTPDKPISVVQVLQSIDNAYSQQHNLTNTNKWETEFKAWLATPAGKAYADANPTPNAALVKKFAGVTGPYEGIATDLNELKKKVKLLPGPGAFDPDDPSSSYKIIGKAKADAIGAQMLASQGGKFTASEKAGVKVYTGHHYSSMNDWLRGKTNDISTSHKTAITQTQKAMRPLPEKMLLHRGVYWDAIPEGFQTTAGAKKLVGETLMDEAFMSSSIGGTPGLGAGRPVIFEIECPAGTQAAWVEGNSSNNGEREMLLGAGQHYKILGVELKNSQTYIRMRIVTPNDGPYAG